MTAEQCAALVEEMIGQQPWSDKAWARCALAIAARAIRRGSHLTEQEKLENLFAALNERDKEDTEITDSER